MAEPNQIVELATYSNILDSHDNPIFRLENRDERLPEGHMSKRNKKVQKISIYKRFR